MVPPPWQGRSGEGGGSCPPMGELSINLVGRPRREHQDRRTKAKKLMDIFHLFYYWCSNSCYGAETITGAQFFLT